MDHKTRMLSTTFEEGGGSLRENPIREVTGEKDDSLQRGSELTSEITSENASQNLVNHFSFLSRYSFIIIVVVVIIICWDLILKLLSIGNSFLYSQLLILCAAADLEVFLMTSILVVLPFWMAET